MSDELSSNSQGRSKAFSRNRNLENFLHELNTDLWPAEQGLIQRQSEGGRLPVILLMGPLRSGTTLFMQWLANTGLVSYPTNLLSRFYHAPILGAKIQLILTDPRFNFRNELGEFIHQAEYKSENGKTQGVLSPNEFWYFWRRFLADPSRDVWSDEELKDSMDIQTMKAELAGIVDVFQKPFAAKCMLFNYNIPFLNAILDDAIFIQIRRDPVENVASALDARIRQMGSEAAWYSFKIPEYASLKDLAPVEQVAGQIHYINNAVSSGLQMLPESRKMLVEYEEFCQNPKKVFVELVEKLKIAGQKYSGNESFEKSRSVKQPDSDLIKQALRIFE